MERGGIRGDVRMDRLLMVMHQGDGQRAGGRCENAARCIEHRAGVFGRGQRSSFVGVVADQGLFAHRFQQIGVTGDRRRAGRAVVQRWNVRQRMRWKD